MAGSAAPLLSTPATHMLEEQIGSLSLNGLPRLSDHEIFIRYEIQKTLLEIKRAKFARVALQFPHDMLPDAPRIFEQLRNASNSWSPTPSQEERNMVSLSELSTNAQVSHVPTGASPTVKYFILADTSYGACCVDEIAAEHVEADLVVHYGRACLSPTSRIPVIHVFTILPLEHTELIKDFQSFFTDARQKIILMADITYQSHLREIHQALEKSGYTNIFVADIVHDPSSLLPNRTTPEEVAADPRKMQDWDVLHISQPPESLLLNLASRVARIRIYPTSEIGEHHSSDPFLVSTSRALSRRYALLTSVATVSIFGILINTLSVKNYNYIVDHVKSQILAAGKKSYTFVVGKVNAAKIANFSEIGAWVVIGCWESSLIGSKDFWKPVLTPFELGLALQSDDERIWTGEWSSDFQQLLGSANKMMKETADNEKNKNSQGAGYISEQAHDSDAESTPPDFDLRTGRYVSHSRPMQISGRTSVNAVSESNSLIQRASGELGAVAGKGSPAADFLRSTRTWRGLGSEFEIAYEETGAPLEQGSRGIAKGYTHIDDGLQA